MTMDRSRSLSLTLRGWQYVSFRAVVCDTYLEMVLSRIPRVMCNKNRSVSEPPCLSCFSQGIPAHDLRARASSWNLKLEFVNMSSIQKNVDLPCCCCLL